MPKIKTLSSKKAAMIKKIIPFLGLIILFVLFSLTTGGNFFTLKNMRNLISQAAVTMVASIGCCFVMSHDNLDFSLGGACALCATVSIIVGDLISPWLMLPVCVIVGMLSGLLTATLHIKARIPAFMAGMCIMFAGRGVAQGAHQVFPMTLPTQYKVLQNVWFYLAIVLVVFAAGYILFEYTKVGKYNKLIGSNPKCAALSGINVGKYKTIAFVISGFTVGIAAFMTTIRGGGVGTSTGSSLETNVLLALTLGGFPLTGGSSSKIRSAIIGTLTLYILNNGLQLWGIDPSLIYIVKGVVFLAVVYISIDRGSGRVMV